MGWYLYLGNGMRSFDWSRDAVSTVAPSTASAAREWVSAYLAEHGLSHLQDSVRVVVSELVTNALVHARTPFTLTLSQSTRTLLVRVEDGSPEAPVLRTPAPMEDTGHGLRLVEALSRDWGHVPGAAGSKVVWASFSKT